MGYVPGSVAQIQAKVKHTSKVRPSITLTRLDSSPSPPYNVAH